MNEPAIPTLPSSAELSYARHRPETTLLYENVEREFREYLRCGRLEHGFARLHCDACARDVFVAFSCKGRGVCPSCGARRMCDSAARLTDHVFPPIPVRQTQRGVFASVDERGRVIALDETRDDRRFARAKTDPFAAEVDGFDVHAGVFVSGDDREGRERLFRYAARPAVSLSRMSRLPDGRIAYRLKHPGSHGHTHRIVTPLEFLARVAALVPPPKYPLVRYHGVFAPNSRWRRDVVPRREPPRVKLPPCAPASAGASVPKPAQPLGPDAVVRKPPKPPTRPGRPGRGADRLGNAAATNVCDRRDEVPMRRRAACGRDDHRRRRHRESAAARRRDGRGGRRDAVRA